jgi:hypothetical protein
MTANREFTSTDLVRITGMKPRWVQALAEKNIIRPEPDTDRAGTGTPRRFSQNEAIVACVVATFARRKMTVGSIQKVANTLRDWLPNFGQPFLNNIREGWPCFFVIKWVGAKVEFHFVATPDDPKALPFIDVFQPLIEGGDGVADVIYLTKILRDVV